MEEFKPDKILKAVKEASKGRGETESLKDVSRKEPRKPMIPKPVGKGRRVIEQYKLVVDDVITDIKVVADPNEFIPIYQMTFPVIEPATEAALDYVREKMITEMDLRPAEILSPDELKSTKEKFIAGYVDFDQFLPILALFLSRVIFSVRNFSFDVFYP